MPYRTVLLDASKISMLDVILGAGLAGFVDNSVRLSMVLTLEFYRFTMRFLQF